MAGNGLAVCSVLPFRRLIQHSKQAFRARHGHERLIQLVADVLDRIKKQVGEKKEHHQVAHFHVQPAVPAQRAERAEQGHRAEEKLAFQLQQRHEHRRRLRHAHVVFAMHVNQFLEEARIDRHAARTPASRGCRSPIRRAWRRRGSRIPEPCAAAGSSPAGNFHSQTR